MVVVGLATSSEYTRGSSGREARVAVSQRATGGSAREQTTTAVLCDRQRPAGAAARRGTRLLIGRCSSGKSQQAEVGSGAEHILAMQPSNAEPLSPNNRF